MIEKISTNLKMIQKIKEETKPNVNIEREVSVLFDGRQFLIKIPKEISQFYDLKKKDKIKLIIEIKEPPKKHENHFEIIQK